MAVNIESQMADRVMNNQEFKYKGFNRYSINFKPEDVDATDIAHARSLFHPMLQNYVLRDIASDSTWMYNIWMIHQLELLAILVMLQVMYLQFPVLLQ